MTKTVFHLSVLLSVTASLLGPNLAYAQKDSGQVWSPQMGPPGLQQPGAITQGQQSNPYGVGQPGPNSFAQQGPYWAPQRGPNAFAQRTGPVGAQQGPDWAPPTRPNTFGFGQPGSGGDRPGTTWSQSGGSNLGQSQAQSWAEQQARNAEMTKQALQAQANAPVRPQVAQYERWKQEWAQQHPGEPLPNMPTLERLHHGEIMSNIQQQGQDMWARRRQEVQARYQMARNMQTNKNAAAHVTWSKQQWAQWDKQYDQEQHQNAIDYVNNFAKAGEDARMEEANRQYRQSLGLDH
jgi:hypothetical protein